MNDSSISVVVICFNGWKYIHNCLHSLENQTNLPDEIIFVDDCSTDNSYTNLLNYAKESKLNISVIENPKNVGPSISRRNGLLQSHSQFVCFCDCDDWYEDCFIEDMKRTILEQDNLDLIVFDNFNIVGNNKKKANITTPLIGANTSELLALYSMSLWRFMVRRDLLVNHVYFPPLYNGEDGAVAPQVIEKSKNTIVVDKAYYNYLCRRGSASTRPSKNAYLSMVNANSVVQEKVSDCYSQEKEFLGIKFICIAATLNAFKANVPSKEIVTIYDDFLEQFPRWYENKYLRDISKFKKVYLYALKNKKLLLCRVIAIAHYLMNLGR